MCLAVILFYFSGKYLSTLINIDTLWACLLNTGRAHTNTIQFGGRRQYGWKHIIADFEMHPKSFELNW